MPRSIYALVPLVGAIGALAAADSWVFGDSLFYLGPPSSNAAIVKATYSITPPDVPSGYEYSGSSDAPWVSVWVGASASESSNDYNLYQPLFNWSPDQESQGCSASVDQWCVAASTFTPASQIGQTYVTVPKNTAVDFESTHYPVMAGVAVANEKVTQTVTMNGKVISKQTDALDTSLKYLLSSDECYTGSGSCGSLNPWYIRNLTVTLDKADTSFANTLALNEMTAEDLKTTDGGITWTSDSLKVQSVHFDE